MTYNDIIKLLKKELNLSYIVGNKTPMSTYLILRKYGIQGGSIGPTTVTQAYKNKNKEVEQKVHSILTSLGTYIPQNNDHAVNKYFIESDRVTYILSFNWMLFDTYHSSRNLDPGYKTYWYVLNITKEKRNLKEVAATDRPKTLKQLNNYIQKIWPEIKVAKGNGYFYIYSDDEEIDTKIARLYSSTIEGMWPMGTFSYEEWKKSIQDVLDDWQRYESERIPVYENSIKKLREYIKSFIIKETNEQRRVYDLHARINDLDDRVYEINKKVKLINSKYSHLLNKPIGEKQLTDLFYKTVTDALFKNYSEKLADTLEAKLDKDETELTKLEDMLNNLILV